MRLTYYIDSFFPSAKANTVHVMRMCRAFSNLGNSVTLVCNGRYKNNDIDNIWKQYGIENVFNIKQVFVPHIIEKYGHRLGSYYSAYLKSKVDVKTDLAYSRSATSLFFIRNKVEYIFEAHIEPDSINKAIEKAVLKHKNCKGLVVISNALKERYMQLYPFLPENKILVLHDGADADNSDPWDKVVLQGNNEEIKIGYLGHLYPGKCMETLLPLAKRCKEYKFHVVGGTEYWVEHWKNAAKEQGVENVIFYGFVNNAEAHKYYKAFDICIMPFSTKISIGKNGRMDIGKWTSPLKLFEAMSFGKAILASNLQTLQEVMTDNEDCLFANADDVDDWVEKLRVLVRNEELRNKLGKSAKQKLEENYTWNKRCETIIKYINLE